MNGPVYQYGRHSEALAHLGLPFQWDNRYDTQTDSSGSYQTITTACDPSAARLVGCSWSIDTLRGRFCLLDLSVHEPTLISKPLVGQHQ